MPNDTGKLNQQPIKSGELNRKNSAHRLFYCPPADLKLSMQMNFLVTVMALVLGVGECMTSINCIIYHYNWQVLEDVYYQVIV